MKRILFIMVLMFIVGCSNGATPTDSPTERPDLVPLETFEGSSETVSVAIPEWDSVASQDPFNHVTKQKGTCSFALNIVEGPKDWYLRGVRDFAVDNGGIILSEDPLSYTLSGEYTFLTKTASVFCADKTYTVLFSCLEDRYDDEVASKYLDSLSCERTWTKGNPKLGLVASPEDPDDITTFYEAYTMIRDANVGLTHFPVPWGKDEEAIDLLTSIVRDKGLDLNLGFEIIHTSVLGSMPMDFPGWEDKDFATDYADFVNSVIADNEDIVRTISIGNEVDIYFKIHPEELEGYKVFYERVYDAVKAEHPQVLIGTTFAYHEMKGNDNFESFDVLGDIGDLNLFTLYVYNEGFEFTKDASLIGDYLDEISELTDNKKYALQEVGWNTADSLKGEEDDQVEAVNEFFDFIEGSDERLVFANWFLLHDGHPKDCRNAALSFLEPDDPIIDNEEFMQPFEDFLCDLGLLDNDGNPKKAWSTFRSRGAALE